MRRPGRWTASPEARARSSFFVLFLSRGSAHRIVPTRGRSTLSHQKKSKGDFSFCSVPFKRNWTSNRARCRPSVSHNKQKGSHPHITTPPVRGGVTRRQLAIDWAEASRHNSSRLLEPYTWPRESNRRCSQHVAFRQNANTGYLASYAVPTVSLLSYSLICS